MAHNHYYMDDEKGSALPINPELIYTGSLSDEPSWFNIKHSHEFCEILYIFSGSGYAIINEVQYELNSGDIIIINPMVTHEEKSSINAPLQVIFLAIKDFKLPSLPPCTIISNSCCPVIHCGEYRYRMDLYFKELLQESSNQVEFYKQITHSLLSAILVMIMRICCITTTTSDQHLSGECQKVKRYLDSNFTSPITLEKLSETVYISKHYLSHMFKEQTGTSPIKYLTDKRMARAVELLVGSDSSISSISKQVGYDNPQYFGQVFKKAYGVSPAEYRANK